MLTELQSSDRSAARLRDLTDRFRALQLPSGAVREESISEASLLLEQIKVSARGLHIAFGQQALADAFDDDVDNWRATGLQLAPYFDRTVSAIQPPEDGEPIFVITPYLNANGPYQRGRYIEFFTAIRNESPAIKDVAVLHPHPRNLCQMLRIADGSTGFKSGNSLVFFPENIPAREEFRGQKFAMFFFSKFRNIYQGVTKPNVHRLFGVQDHMFGRDAWIVDDLSESETYDARSVWGYLHDCFHHKGDRPFDEHVKLKTDWFCGLLEEIKVDARTILAAIDHKFPYWEAVIEFILFERIARYPFEPDAITNFDSGTGFLIVERMLLSGALGATKNGFADLDLSRISAAFRVLVQEIEAIERLPDAEYKAAAKAMVRQYLPEGSSRSRFSLPRAASQFLGIIN